MIAVRCFTVAAVVYSVASALSGCQCGDALSPSNALTKSAAVFEGIVVKIKEPAWFESGSALVGRSTDPEQISFEKMVNDRGRRIHFRLTKSWKGASSAQPVVLTLHGGPDCGYPFVVGKHYLVWARRLSSGRLMTDICSRTTRAAEASSDLAFLKKARGGR